MKKIFALVLSFALAATILFPISSNAAGNDVAWYAPLTYEDGQCLTTLASHKVYVGLSSGQYNPPISILSTGIRDGNCVDSGVDSGLTCWSTDPLVTRPAGNWPRCTYRTGGFVKGTQVYVVVTATDMNGLESDYSNEASGIAKTKLSKVIMLKMIINTDGTVTWEIPTP